MVCRTPEPRASSKPSMLVTHTIFSVFGKKRRKKRRESLKGSITKKRKHNDDRLNWDQLVVIDNGTSPLVTKYWFQRYDLFSKYDLGIRMDEEGWFSVTPEAIAVQHAERCNGRRVIDGFTGVGGNAIQFARKHCRVLAIDIDHHKIDLAFNNAKVYGVDKKIDFVVGDFFELAPSLKGDVVFLSPPWGGPMYRNIKKFSLDLLKPRDGYSLFQTARKITPDIIMFLPRNIDLLQVEKLAQLSSPPLALEIEENYVRNNLKGITAYFGGTART